MPKKPTTKPVKGAQKKIENISHKDQKRTNIPTAEYESLMQDQQKTPIRVAYERRNRDLDPQLVWRGKDEQDASDLVVNAPPLYIQEKVHPRVLIEDLKSETQRRVEESEPTLFGDFNGIGDHSKSTDFYHHQQNWTNRMILGDSLQVMASLAEREGLRGKVQCIYLDPPYGIKFNSNFQWSTTSREVKDGSKDHITREPEQVKAFRDTWRDGIHSYLTYLRDRLEVARDLLHESGSIFVQIGDENVHRVRALMDEVFGDGNFVLQISSAKTGGQTAELVAGVADYILWFAKSREHTKFRRLYQMKEYGGEGADKYTSAEDHAGKRGPISKLEDFAAAAGNYKIFRKDTITSQRPPGSFPVPFRGREITPRQNYWKTHLEGMVRLDRANRLESEGNGIAYVRYLQDFPAFEFTNMWTDVGGIQSRSDPKIYVVQSASTLIQRCLLMTTDPGDLVLDPTCVRKGTNVLTSRAARAPLSPRTRGGEDAAGYDVAKTNAGSPPRAGELEGGALVLPVQNELTAIPIENLQPGDFVYSHDGSLNRVKRVLEKFYRGAMIQVTTVGGQTLTCTADHRVLAILKPRSLGGNATFNHIARINFERARDMRKNRTAAEKLLWNFLMQKKTGFKFRQQHPIDKYIVDFYCREAALVVEVDGSIHDKPEQQKYDLHRETKLRALGLSVIRLTNEDVLTNIEGVLAAIRSQCVMNTEHLTQARWVQAGNLRKGDIVFAATPRVRGVSWVDGGDFSETHPTVITSIQSEYATETVYDIEVENAHSFIADGIAVHNCGSGTTAYVAEQWGRRWITIDTSRVALALARSRLMGARYPYYIMADSEEGQRKEAEVSGRPGASTGSAAGPATRGDIRLGFVYERVPHITLKSIANNAEIDVIWEKWQKTLEPLREKLNSTAKTKLEEWEIPREPSTGATSSPQAGSGFGANWTPEAKKLLEQWWQARIARQKEIDASIANKAEYEYLYDRPYEDKSRVRVAGPFTVESVSPHRTMIVDENHEIKDPLAKAAEYDTGREVADFAQMVLDNLKTAGVQQAHKEGKINFNALKPWPGEYIAAEGMYSEGPEGKPTKDKRAGIFIGPEFGTVSRTDLVAAAREAVDSAFDVLISCAFNYEAHTSEFDKLGKVPVLKARMNPDLHMADNLKNTGKGNLFVVFGEPDIEINTNKKGQYIVKVKGVDVFKPQTGEIESGDADSIALWMIDTDYNEESFFVRHAYFLGANDPYKALKTTLKADIDEEAWATLNSDTSRPFDKPSTGRIAVKVINHLGDEVMKVFKVT